MNINGAFPSKFISANDLQGTEVTVTMTEVRMEEVDSSKPPMPVLYFQGHQKGLALNKTNANNIASLHGEETNVWIGRQVVLYPTTTEFQGKVVACIRIRGVIPGMQAGAVPGNTGIQAPAAPLPASEHADSLASDDIPF